MATVLITGGTGIIGQALSAALLKQDYTVIIMSRSQKKDNGGQLSYAQWDIGKGTIDTEAIGRADYIVHLAGANVGEKRWTKKRKQEIVDSRVKSGELLVKAIKENAKSMKALISSSAIGWYGPDAIIPNPSPFVESDPHSETFLGTTCLQWEKSVAPVREMNKRLVYFRTGIVLSNAGGALKEFKRPVKFGMATILGSGKQVVSWIHIDDVVKLYVNAIENESINGIYNAVAPVPVSNKELILAIANKMKGRFFLPVHIPSFVLKTVLGELSIEVLKSATVSCKKIQDSGFSFSYPTIDVALDKLLN